MSDNKDGIFNVGISIWISICVVVCFWFWSNFTKGRGQFQNNLHAIEEGLRRMQADIELRQREKSIGCVEDVEDISEFLKKFYEEENIQKEDNVEAVPIMNKDETILGNKEKVEDKKTI
ncbi:uncharacterized protein LOC130445670 [Diorhabda sublineata]|uniref:uncharacterized protein LOC130445670 n=1 Tax=Diorhabda sublineata TaxID=1163346 RepID=UPI0024E0AB1A|nr:uncharacterized protein LOC130445670 [Diorhabda sublineata]